MMGREQSCRTAATLSALQACVGAVSERGPRTWDAEIRNGSVLKLSARMEERWLVIDAHLRSYRTPKADRLWETLTLNGAIRGGARLLPSSKASVGARAEIPLDRGVPLEARVLEACLGIQDASAKLKKKSATTEADSPAHPDESGRDLPSLLHEAGWPFVERAAGTLVVNLDVPGSFHQAMVTKEPRGGVRLSVELVAKASLPPVRRRALALLLLITSASVRMARPAAEQDGAAAAIWFEVIFGSSPCPAEIAHALSSLSVACRTCAREASALHLDDELARTYLSVRGRSSGMFV